MLYYEIITAGKGSDDAELLEHIGAVRLGHAGSGTVRFGVSRSQSDLFYDIVN